RGGCVDRLLFEIKVASGGIEFAQKADEILQRSAKPVYRPRGNDIELAAHNLSQKPIELRPLVAPFSAAEAFVGEFVDDDPPLAPTDCLGKRLALVVDGLPIFRRDPKIEGNSLGHRAILYHKQLVWVCPVCKFSSKEIRRSRRVIAE